jgi:hypothetical protein
VSDLIELGRRAVACKGWRWLPGMRTDLRERVPEDDDPYDSHPDSWADAIPDLSDPATLGCLVFSLLPSLGYYLRLSRYLNGCCSGWWNHRRATARHMAQTPIAEVAIMALEDHSKRGSNS